MKLRDLVNKGAHVLSGFFTSITLPYLPIFSILSFLLFMIYEIGQYWYKNDQPSQEIREFSVGFYLGVIFLLWVLHLPTVSCFP